MTVHLSRRLEHLENEHAAINKKIEEKNKAIKLRKQGKTYVDILRAVPVAKSTLALWLKEAKLSQAQNQKF